MNKDLIALVADIQQEKTLATLLTQRQEALGIQAITFDIFRHPHKDAGVYHEAADFLAPYRPPIYRRALVMLDREFPGSPGNSDSISNTIHESLSASGWQEENCEVIVIDPELEVWVWADSPAVPEVLRTTWDNIHALGRSSGYWPEERVKPKQPKELLESLLRQQRIPRSSAIFQEIARRVSLRRCQDPAFLLLRETLQKWFWGT